MNRGKGFVLFSFLLLCSLFFLPASQAQIDDATRKLSYDVFKQLIEVNSTDKIWWCGCTGWENTNPSC